MGVRLTEKALAELLRSNPELRISAPHSFSPPPARGRSSLAERFLVLWRSLGGPPLEREFRFHPTRRWRFDFALPARKIAIELNGGVWNGGRHVRGRGYLRDREKINAAVVLGWRVFELGTGQITQERIAPIVALATESSKQRNSNV